MKWLMIMSFIVLAGQQSQAEEYVSPDGAILCLTDFDLAGNYESDWEFERAISWYTERPHTLHLYQASRWTCRERGTLLDGLDMISITFESAAVLAGACTLATGGVSASGAVAFGAFGLVTRIARFTISKLPCRDLQNQREIEKITQDVLCKATGQGPNCDLANIQFTYKDEQRYTPIERI